MGLALNDVPAVVGERGFCGYTLQVMSWPQHIGDLILPCPFGHFEICTSLPSSSFRLSSTSGASHFAQLAFTPIPHFEHSYVAIFIPPGEDRLRIY
jgi:hypothetical protein